MNSISLWYDNVKLDAVNEIEYLGVLFSSSACFNSMSKSVVRRASQTTSSVISVMIRSRLDSWKDKVALYNSIVLGAMQYCCCIWALRYLDVIERVQVRFYKTLLSLPRNCPDYMVRLETGSKRLSLVVLGNSLSWLENILAMKPNRYPYICYRRLLELRNCDSKYNWVLQMRDLLLLCGSNLCWETLTLVSLRRSKHHIMRCFEEWSLGMDLERLRNSTFPLLYQKFYLGVLLRVTYILVLQ